MRFVQKNKPILNNETNNNETNNNETNLDKYKIPPLFDWEYYVWYNRDLIRAGINTEQSAILHWNKFGQKEKRSSYNVKFDWEYYIVSNKELFKYDINKEIAPNDVNRSLKSKAIEHWQKIGEREGRIAMDDTFNWEIYKINYPELTTIGVYTKQDYITHWIKYGKPSEKIGSNIQNSSNIDINYYFNKYNHIQWFTMDSLEKAMLHWNIYGRNSNYLKSVNHEREEDQHFNWKYYIEMNNYKQYFNTEKAAINHWNEAGKKYGIVGSNHYFKQMYTNVLSYRISDETNKILRNNARKNHNMFFQNANDNNIHMNSIELTTILNKPLFKEMKIIPNLSCVAKSSNNTKGNCGEGEFI